jgi:hypothetical protein
VGKIRRDLLPFQQEDTMKIPPSVLCTLASLSCLFLVAFSGAQAQQPASPEKLQHIRKLVIHFGYYLHTSYINP